MASLQERAKSALKFVYLVFAFLFGLVSLQVTPILGVVLLALILMLHPKVASYASKVSPLAAISSRPKIIYAASISVVMLISILLPGTDSAPAEPKSAVMSEEESRALLAEQKRKAEEAEEAEEKAERARVAALTPSLIMKCVNKKGWLVYIAHRGSFATFIRPMENPQDSVKFVAERVRITTYGKPEYWYNEDDLNEGWNTKARFSSSYRGISQAKLDLREEGLGGVQFKNNPSFAMSARYKQYGKTEWTEGVVGGTYRCSDISLATFDEAFAKYKK